MKKKVWLTITMVLVLTVSVSIAAACIEVNRKKQPESDLYYFDETAMAEKLYTAPNGTKKILTYVHSREGAKENPLHYYQDAVGNQYYFNEKGDMIGHKQAAGDAPSETQQENEVSNLEVQSGEEKEAAKADTETQLQAHTSTENEPPTVAEEKEEAPSKSDTETQPQVNPSAEKDSPRTYISDASATPEEQKIIDAARKYATEIYGEEYISKFSYSKMLVNEAIKTSDVFFYIRYKERFVTECCMVTLREDKSLGSNDALIVGKGVDADFDPSLLDGIEIKDLEQFAQQKIKEKYQNNYHSYEIENDISVIRNDNGGFDLSVVVQVKTTPERQPERIKCYYPLNQKK